MSYTHVAKALHWVIALLIIGQFMGGWLMTHLALGTDTEYNAYQLHKSFGLIVLALSLFRLWWRLTHKPPAAPASLKGWERQAASFAHFAFYVLMISIPMAGWLMVSADPYQIPTKIFFFIPVFHWPVPAGEGITGLFKEVHEYMAFGAMGLLVLHVAGAIKHELGPEEGVLHRMVPQTIWPRLMLWAGGATLAALAVLGLTSAITMGFVAEGEAAGLSDRPPPQTTETLSGDMEGNWQLIAEASSVTLTGKAYGNEMSVTLPDIDARILLDPDGPTDDASIDATLAIGALTGGSSDAVSRLKSQNWFDVASFPVATFKSIEIRRLAEGTYEADGELTVRDATIAVMLPFSLEIDGDRAIAQGTVTVDRTALSLGGSAGGIDPNVTVSLEITAERL